MKFPRCKKVVASNIPYTGCGKSPWTKIKSAFARILNGYS